MGISRQFGLFPYVLACCSSYKYGDLRLLSSTEPGSLKTACHDFNSSLCLCWLDANLGLLQMQDLNALLTTPILTSCLVDRESIGKLDIIQGILHFPKM